MAQIYVPVLLLLAAAIAFTGVMLLLNRILGPKRSHTDPELPAARWIPFECGHDPVQEDNRQRISVKFYLVAILFVLFDLEVVLLYPWAVAARDLGIFGFVELLAFVATLLIGLLYAWKKGALEWR